MSLSYEGRNFMADATYPSTMGMHDQEEFKSTRYPSPPPPLSDPYNAQVVGNGMTDELEMPELPKEDSEAPSPGRSKPIPKPNREITKDANGRYICDWTGCTEEQRTFVRRCEWSKHMDKHDRPYKCQTEGCEKLPGFSYSGGLLRHEREVHGKHGGPKKQLNCPHPNCKRHTGKGFSRQENLNEHLRRVHTDSGVLPNVDETETEDTSDGKSGQKRKRSARSDSAGLRDEVKRLRHENEEFRRQIESQKRQSEAQNAQTAEMMHQIQQLQTSMTGRMHAPQMSQAGMTGAGMM